MCCVCGKGDLALYVSGRGGGDFLIHLAGSGRKKGVSAEEDVMCVCLQKKKAMRRFGGRCNVFYVREVAMRGGGGAGVSDLPNCFTTPNKMTSEDDIRDWCL